MHFDLILYLFDYYLTLQLINIGQYLHVFFFRELTIYVHILLNGFIKALLNN